MATRIQFVELEAPHVQCLPKQTQKALAFFSSTKIISRDWYLAGGTAFALQSGHRRSVDLDFFTPKSRFRETTLERLLFQTGKWHTTFIESGTVYGEFDGAKMSFIAYPFFIPSKKRFCVGSVQLLTKEDIAVMKIIATSQRGRKRDFVDLYWYCRHVEPLASLLRRAPAQYPGQEQNLPHFLKSLVYFEDAEADPMPVVYFQTSWRIVKAFFLKEVPRVAKELLS